MTRGEKYATLDDPAHERLRLLEQYPLVVRSLPRRRRHDVMKLLVVPRTLTSRHGFHALALPRSDQATQVHRRPAPLTLVPELRQKWLRPLLKLRLPLRLVLVHRTPLKHGATRMEKFLA